MAAFNEYSERFLNVISELGYSDYKIWNEVESLSKATMSKIRRGICGVSMNALCDFIAQYPHVNADYIIVGRGPMFIQEQNSDEEKIRSLMKALNEALDENTKLKEENNILRMAFKKLQSS